MSQELVYTSAPQGLKPGSKGFCTVAMTSGLSAAWVERLESLSGYRPVFSLGDPQSDRNPVNWSHWRISIGGKARSVLSRIAFAGADYSQRSNKFAHLVVLDPTEQAAGGPTWIMLSGMMRTNWSGSPRNLPEGPTVPHGDRAPTICAAWKKATGDAGWAAALAESFLKDPAKPAYLIYQPGTDVLNLFDESLSLVPQSQRWAVTFSTFFTELPLNLSCAWRAVVAETPAAREALRLGPRAIVLDLARSPGEAPGGALADRARSGVISQIAENAPVSIPALETVQKNTVFVETDFFGLEEETPESESIQEVSAIGQRKKLVTSIPLKDHNDFSPGAAHRPPPPRQRPTQSNVTPHRGMNHLILLVTALICGGIGGVIGYKINPLLQRQRKFPTEPAAISPALTVPPASPTTRSDDFTIDSLKRENSMLSEQHEDDGRTIARLTKTVTDLTTEQSQPATVVQSPNSANAGHQAPSDPSNLLPVDWTAINDSSVDPGEVPITILEGAFVHCDDKMQLTLPLLSETPARIAIAWPNNRTTYSPFDPRGSISLSQEFKGGSEGISLRVVGNYNFHYFIDKQCRPICLTMHDGKFSCDRNDPSIENSTLIDDAMIKALRNSTINVFNRTGKVIGRFGFPNSGKPSLITSPPFTTNIPVSLPVILSSSPIPNWEQSVLDEHSVHYVFKDPQREFTLNLKANTIKSKSIEESNYVIAWDWEKGPGLYRNTAHQLKNDLDSLESDNLEDVIGVSAQKYYNFNTEISSLIDDYQKAWKEKLKAVQEEGNAQKQSDNASQNDKDAKNTQLTDCKKKVETLKDDVNDLKNKLDDQLAPILDYANSLQINPIKVDIKLLNGVEIRSYTIQSPN